MYCLLKREENKALLMKRKTQVHRVKPFVSKGPLVLGVRVMMGVKQGDSGQRSKPAGLIN